MNNFFASFLGSTQSVTRTVILSYTVVDERTMSVYAGHIKLGIIPPECTLTEEVIKSNIRRWPRALNIVKGDRSYLYIQWDVPKSQTYLKTDIKTGFTHTNIGNNLGLQNWVVNSSIFALKTHEILLYTTPTLSLNLE